MKTRCLLPAAVAVVAIAAALIVPAPVRAADDAATLLPKMEASLWEGWKTHDPAPFEKHLAEGTLNTNAAGVEAGKAKAIANIKSTDCVVTSYALGEMTVHRFGDATAILTYQATQDATCKGEKVPAKVNVTSVWFKQGDHWLAASYHESAAAAK
jgi:uncharacterized protein DUF4440